MLEGMHELPTAEKILAIALRHARAGGAEKILAIRLEIGAVSGLETVWLQRYFSRLAAGTPAEGAVLRAVTVPARAVCGGCGEEFDLDLRAESPTACPACGSTGCRVSGGSEFRVKDMEVT